MSQSELPRHLQSPSQLIANEAAHAAVKAITDWSDDAVEQEVREHRQRARVATFLAMMEKPTIEHSDLPANYTGFRIWLDKFERFDVLRRELTALAEQFVRRSDENSITERRWSDISDYFETLEFEFAEIEVLIALIMKQADPNCTLSNPLPRIAKILDDVKALKSSLALYLKDNQLSNNGLALSGALIQFAYELKLRAAETLGLPNENEENNI